MSDTPQSIRRSASRFFSGTILSRLSGMLRDMSMAYAFGMQPAIAAFMLAFRLSHLFRRLFGEGALQSAFIPEFEALRHQDSQSAFSFFRDLAYGLTLFLTGLIVILCLGLGAVLQWGNLSDGNYEVIFLTLLMLPSLLFICLFGINTALLQCEKSYFIPAVAPVAFNVIWILAVLYLQDVETQAAMPWLSVGVIFACFGQWMLTVPKTYAILKKNLKDSPFNPLKFNSQKLRGILKPLSLGIVGVAASQINVAIDALFARFAEAEGPAMLWYAIRLQQLPLALFGIALAGAILPPLSRALKTLDWAKYHYFLKYALLTTFAFMLPITAAIFMLGDSSINLIYGHGDFDQNAVIATTKCLWGYGAGLIPSAMVLIMAPACYADGNYRSPALASFFTMVLNIILNYLFIMLFGWGAVSVAVATSISSWVNFVFLGNVLNKKGSLYSADVVNPLLKVFLITLIASVGTYLFRVHLQDLPLLQNYSRDTLPQLFAIISQTSVFFILYGAGFFGLGLNSLLKQSGLEVPFQEKLPYTDTEAH